MINHMRSTKYAIITLFLFLLSFQLSGQNVIHYSYDSAGNRTQRDTTSTNVTMSPAVDRNVVLEASYDLPSTGDFGEVVISGGGTSPEPLAGCQVLEKFWPIESQIKAAFMGNGNNSVLNIYKGPHGQLFVCRPVDGVYLPTDYFIKGNSY